jgi:hypothetical protein
LIAFFAIETYFAASREKKEFEKNMGPGKVKFPVPYCKEEFIK